MLFFRKVVSTFRQHARAAWEWLYGRAYVLLALTTLLLELRFGLQVARKISI